MIEFEHDQRSNPFAPGTSRESQSNLFPWIDEPHSGWFEIAHVSGHDSKTMSKRSCRDKSVRRSNLKPGLSGPGSNFTPDLSNLPINRQDPITVKRFEF